MRPILAWLRPAVVLAAMAALCVGCEGEPGIVRIPSRQAADRSPTVAPSRTPRASSNVYAATAPGHLSAAVAGVRPRVYVPESQGSVVDVIDARTLRVVRRLQVGEAPQHVTPAWGLRRLYVNDTASNELTVIDPRTGKAKRTIPVPDPYNLYFTPDGKRAIVVAERYQRLDFRNPRTWRLIRSVRIPWSGVDHLDFSADGSYLVATTEYGGVLVKVDLRKMRVAGHVRLGGLPVDIKLAPDGTRFFVANQGRGGVSIVDAQSLREQRFLKTGAGAHGLCISRDSRRLYVSNRLAGTITVISVGQRRVVRTWHVGGSPDMLQVSPNGRRLWTANRFNAAVSVIDTRTGRVVRRIATGPGPHGLAYFPQPGRFSIGHNGVYR